MIINVADIFKQFCKERHIEDKGRNYNLLQEIYANTELFDLTSLKVPEEYVRNVYVSMEGTEMTFEVEELKNVSLPFANNFILFGTDERGSFCSIFLREYSPTIVTGTMYTVTNEGYTLNVPFTIRTEEGILRGDITPFAELQGISALDCISWKNRDKLNNVKKLFESGLTHVIVTLRVLNNLPKYAVASDTQPKSDYYTRKHASTLKVSNRPIYYVLDKKMEKMHVTSCGIKARGTLEFTHSFKVRGHWRTLQTGRVGKDRNGDYKIKGYTWVTEHIKGTGELVHRTRIIL